jgi:prepilin-type processing-associated H-X9-DG protein
MPDTTPDNTNRTLTELEQRWRKQHRHAARVAKRTLWRIRVMLWGGLILCLMGLYNAVAQIVFVMTRTALPLMPEPGATAFNSAANVPTSTVTNATVEQLPLHIFSLLLIMANIALICYLAHSVQQYVYRKTHLLEDRENFVPLSDRGVAKIDAVLNPLCQRMQVARDRIVLLRPLQSRSFSPSVVEGTEAASKVYMVIPADFLTVLRTHPQAAEAMLAHELGHVVQSDARLWLYASAFSDRMLRLFVPFDFLNLGILLAIATLLVLFTWPPPDNVWFVAAICVLSGVGPLLALLFFWSQIRSFRRISEELADMAAYIFCHPPGVGLQEALELHAVQKARADKATDPNGRAEKAPPPLPGEEAASFGFFGDLFSPARYFGIHPPASRRIGRVQHYNEVARGERRRLRTAGYAVIGQGILIGLGAFIVVMIIVLVPVFGQARAKARQAACLSNMKQIGLALSMYSMDYDERLPAARYGSGEWSTVLNPYIKNDGVFTCPSDPKPRKITVENTGATYSLSYIPNFSAIARPPRRGYSEAMFESPAQTITITERNENATDDGVTAYQGDQPLSWQQVEDPTSAIKKQIAWDRHSGGFNNVFVDGHARFYKLKATFDPDFLWGKPEPNEDTANTDSEEVPR